MIYICLPSWPDKHRVKPSAIKDIVIYHPVDCNFETRITHNGIDFRNRKEDPCWDIDVFVTWGPTSVRVPALSREGVTTADMLMEMMEADNGSTSDFVKTLIGQADHDGLWAAYQDEHREGV